MIVTIIGIYGNQQILHKPPKMQFKLQMSSVLLLAVASISSAANSQEWTFTGYSELNFKGQSVSVTGNDEACQNFPYGAFETASFKIDGGESPQPNASVACGFATFSGSDCTGKVLYTIAGSENLPRVHAEAPEVVGNRKVASIGVGCKPITV